MQIHLPLLELRSLSIFLAEEAIITHGVSLGKVQRDVGGVLVGEWKDELLCVQDKVRTSFIHRNAEWL